MPRLDGGSFESMRKDLMYFQCFYELLRVDENYVRAFLFGKAQSLQWKFIEIRRIVLGISHVLLDSIFCLDRQDGIWRCCLGCVTKKNIGMTNASKIAYVKSISAV